MRMSSENANPNDQPAGSLFCGVASRYLGIPVDADARSVQFWLVYEFSLGREDYFVFQFILLTC